jgi:hypothetical protein
MLVVARRIILMAVLAGLILAPVPVTLAQSAPRLATLTIDIWPEYDRPATVLVIYRGEFAADTPLPAQVKIRIPASAGEPSAVAAPRPGSEAAPVTQWPELIASNQVTTMHSDDWVEVTFTPPSRLFTVEFYDKLNTVTFDRQYKLTWPGDWAAQAVKVNVREPFGATNFQVKPPLPPGTIDEEGLVAHLLDAGVLEVGQAFELSLSYHREDKRTSTEALQLVTPAPTLPPARTLAAATSSSWPLIVALVVGLALIVGGVIWCVRSQQAETFHPYEPPGFRRTKRHRSVRTSRAPRPRPRPAVPPPPEASQDLAGFCTQCGTPLRFDDVFCSRCGARVKGK